MYKNGFRCRTSNLISQEYVTFLWGGYTEAPPLSPPLILTSLVQKQITQKWNNYVFVVILSCYVTAPNRSIPRKHFMVTTQKHNYGLLQKIETPQLAVQSQNELMSWRKAQIHCKVIGKLFAQNTVFKTQTQ